MLHKLGAQISTTWEKDLLTNVCVVSLFILQVLLDWNGTKIYSI